MPVLQDVFANASPHAFGICLPQGNVAVVSSTPTAIYHRELWALLFAFLLAPHQTRVLTDNRAVYHALTKGHGRALSVPEALTATALLVIKNGWVGWIATEENPADDPSRLHLTISVGARGTATRKPAPILGCCLVEGSVVGTPA